MTGEPHPLFYGGITISWKNGCDEHAQIEKVINDPSGVPLYLVGYDGTLYNLSATLKVVPDDPWKNE